MEKSLAPLFVLNILKQYSDEEHLLKQQDIIDELYKSYGIGNDRKTIARHLLNLETAGYNIVHRKNGVYLEDDGFDDSELRLLIDSVVFSKHISAKYAEDIVKKLKSLGNIYFQKRCKSVYSANMITRTKTPELFFNIDEIGKAIESDRKVEFYYNEYGIDKSLHKISDNKFIVDPYQLVASNNHYYLVGKNNETDDTLSFRIERITELSVTDSPREKTNGRIVFDLNKYINEHPYMYSGNAREILMTVKNTAIGEVIDAFGDSFSIIEKLYDSVLIKLYASEGDVYDWAKRFGDIAEIRSPQNLRDKLRRYCSLTFNKYCASEDDRYTHNLDDYEQSPDEGLLKFIDIDLSKKTEFKNYINAKKVVLRNNNLSDVSFLSDFRETEFVDIENNPISDLSVLSGNETIKDLVIKNTEVSDFSFLHDMPNLKSLFFDGEKADNIDGIYGIFGLELLTVMPEVAVKFDPIRLKRSCPNLQIKMIGIIGDGIKITEAVEFIGRPVRLDKVQLIDSLFLVEPRRHNEIITDKKIIDNAIQYAKEHVKFNGYTMQRENHYSYDERCTIIKWLIDSEYIDDLGEDVYEYIGD